MAADDRDKLHPETARLAGRIVVITGALLTLLGILSVVEIGLHDLRQVTGMLALSWFGLLVCVAGRMIARTREWIYNSRWFLFGSLLGLLSITGLLISLAQKDVFKVAIFALIQAASLFIIWRATRIKSTS